MGQDFDFQDWCQEWLNSSGINILEPQVEYNDDGSVKSFAVKQTCDVTGKNILRTHKLDIAFYDQNYKEHIISDVIIGNKEEITQVNVDSVKGPVKAIVINHGAHTYAKIRYDQQTLNNLENDLYRIDDFSWISGHGNRNQLKMEASLKEEYRSKLEGVLAEIEDYLSKSEDAAEAVSPDKSLGRLSRMEAMQDQQLVLEVRRRHKRKKADVLNAIARLEQDQYGNCMFCGNQISADRLDAFPEVQTCVNCA